jgi:predicted dehydrogenase
LRIPEIAIIGSGQIGSRHLQSLGMLSEGAAIHLVDPSRESLALCEARLAEAVAPGRNEALSLFHHADCHALPQGLDAAIIASGSMQRARLCQDLLSASTPRFLLLEKFLFPRVAEYSLVLALIRAKRVPTYVNQWLATTPSFHKILSNLGIEIDLLNRSVKQHDPVQMRVWGAGWGLCCNAVHYLDPFSVLTSGSQLTLQKTDFKHGFAESKRHGYREIFGRMQFSAPCGSSLVLDCADGSSSEWIGIDIDHHSSRVSARFYMDRFECNFHLAGKTWSEILPIPRQSEYTHLILEKFFQTGECALPDLPTSSSQHLLVLNPFLDHFRKYDPRIGEVCPIT